MDRRGFLQGVFGGVTATGLIVAASPGDVEAFAAMLAADAPVILDVPPLPASHVGEHLYNARGECVAVITSVDMIRDRVEVTSAFDGHRIYVPGLERFKIHADGIGHLLWDVEHRGPRTVGVPRR
jgi:hypothetical protein